MIKNLRLIDWKSFKDATLYVDPLTILIGANASGKSNVLDALIFLQKIASGQQLSAAVKGDSKEEGGVRGGIEWLVRRGSTTAAMEVVVGAPNDELLEYHYRLQFAIVDESRIELEEESLKRVRTQKNSTRTYSKNLFYTNNDDLTSPSITTYFATNTQGRGRRFDLRRSFSVLSQSLPLALINDVKDGIEVITESLTKIFVYDPIPSLIRDYATISDRLQSTGANVAGVLAALDPSLKDDIETTLSNYLRRLPEREIESIWAEPVGRLKTDAMLYCRERWGSNGDAFVVDARGMSDGSLRFLAIMTALLTIPSGSLLVVEEIDNGLHPSRASLLVEFLKEVGHSRNVDIICTTHNPALLDAFGNEMIPFISMVYRDETTGMSAIKLLEEFEHLPRLIARGKVGKLISMGLLEKAVNE